MQVREARRRNIKLFLLENDKKKNSRAVSVGSPARLTTHKIGLGKPRTIALSRI